MAPTTMKTVPSGRLEVRMNGASVVGGTEGATTTKAPARVGRFLGNLFVPVDAPVIRAIDEAFEPSPVTTNCDSDAVPVAFAFPLVIDESSSFDFVAAAALDDCEASWEETASERSGSLVCADAIVMKRERAAAESSGKRVNRMLCRV